MTLTIHSGYIAGIPHRNPDLSVVSPGDALKLAREPSNPHDPNAITIHHVISGQFLGYVGREACEGIIQNWADGVTTEATVVSKPMARFKEVIFRILATNVEVTE